MTAHVAMDVRLARSSGHRTYITNLLPRIAALAPSWRWSLLGDASWLAGESWAAFPGARIVHVGSPIYSVAEQIELAVRMPRTADLFWAPHYSIPLFSRTPLAATVHDLAHLRLPEYTRSIAKSVYARTMLTALRRRAREVICVSDFTRRELQAVVGEVARATVVHNAVDAAWFDSPDTAPPPLGAPYFLFVGNLKPHKNVGTLLDAWRLLAADVAEFVVVVGRSEGIRTGDRGLDGLPGDRVRHIEHIDDAGLRALVRGATALVFPSLYEGFGLPPLEAMAAGRPVIAARTETMTEIGGDVPLYFEPKDARGLADLMRRVSGDAALRDRLGARGREQAAKFTWDRAARETHTVLARAIG